MPLLKQILTALFVGSSFLTPRGIMDDESTVLIGEDGVLDVPQMALEQESEKPIDSVRFFSDSFVKGRVGEAVTLSFYTETAVSEVHFQIPEAGIVIPGILPSGFLIEKGTLPQEWIVKTEELQDRYEVPVMFEAVGQYEVAVETTSVIVDISEQELVKEASLVEREEQKGNEPFDELETEQSEGSLEEAPECLHEANTELEDALSVVNKETEEVIMSTDRETFLVSNNLEDHGGLSIEYASTFNFGSQKIVIQDQLYFAATEKRWKEESPDEQVESGPNYIQISDRRSEQNQTGWQLSVRQNEQFTNPKRHQLNGAQLKLSNKELVSLDGGLSPEFQQTNPVTLVPGNKRVLIMAQGNEGAGTWRYYFGDQENADKSISLYVPYEANPEATKYFSTLTWELSTAPGN